MRTKLTKISEIEDEVEEDRDDAAIGVALKYSVLALLLLLGGASGVYIAKILRRQPPVVLAPKPVDLPTVRAEADRELPKLAWKDVTDEAGITFVHVNGAAGEKLLPETMGGGCGFLDYDNDGDQDILLVNSKPWSHDVAAKQQADPSPTTRLYQNDGQGNFTDVTVLVGIDGSVYGQGCAIGDFDNDGDEDFFISAVDSAGQAGKTLTSKLAQADTPAKNPASTGGDNRLYRNDGGKFVDITMRAGVAGDAGEWSSSCGWFDYDNDGDLDLWVCNYIQWSREFDLAQNFRLTGAQRAYGRPQAFGGSYSRLYRNDGNDKFSDVSQAAGIEIDAPTTGTPQGKSLGLTFYDFDRDGNLDVLVANDTVQNNLFRNVGDGTFKEVAAISGVAFDSEGNARGAMGIDVACVRDDPRCACVAIGNFANEMTAFYVSAPNSLVFSDQAVANGLGPSTRLFLTFGVFFFDADLDGWDDVFHANGHLEDDIAKVQASQSYAQSPQLFWNAGPDSPTEFVALPASVTGKGFAEPMVGRGAAFADIDGDGDLDILITATGTKPRLLKNEQQLGNHWLRLHLIGNGKTSNRDAIGARVEVVFESGRTISKIVNRTRSYLSQTELPITVGLGNDSIKSLGVTWPDGKVQTIEVAGIDRMLEVTQSLE